MKSPHILSRFRGVNHKRQGTFLPKSSPAASSQRRQPGSSPGQPRIGNRLDHYGKQN